ncbi:hypothetical protein [Chelativorans sp. Marseille-P2723]|uniref:hypothetical protein n=1 Tax=Chelativorans sp. Marseille-P2723 TaxID=2709133 RepID=UPI00156F307C|nr:hypothetical protein [Chelativorans sp. Marseille-P2723]
MARGGLLSAALPIVKLGTWARNAAGGAIALQAAGMSGAKMTGLQKVTTAFSGIARAVPGFGILKGALTAIGGVITGISAPVAAVIGTLVAGGIAIYKYWDHISSFFTGVGRAIGELMAPAIEEIRPHLEWLAPIGDAIAAGWERVKAVFSSVREWIGNLFSREVLSEKEKKNWERAGYEAAMEMVEAIKSAFTGLVDWAKGIGSRIGSAISTGASNVVGWVKEKAGFGGSAGGAQPVEARAMGGPVRRGRTYLVGEEGPELWQAPSSGRITPTAETLALLSGGASEKGAQVTNHVSVNAPITVTGASNPRETARAVADALTEKLSLTVRGIHADVGVA